jgi:hypothetical protein
MPTRHVYCARGAILALLTFLIVPAEAAGVVLDFEGFDSGQIIDTEYNGVVISALNNHPDGSDAAVVFNSEDPTGIDDFDLGGPFSSINPKLGMLSPGNVLVIQKRNDCDFDAGFCAVADDEGRKLNGKPVGVFTFAFDAPVTLESVDFFDIESNEDDDSPDSEIHLVDADGIEIRPGEFFVPFTGGDNTWNQLVFGVPGVKTLMIELKGSGAIDDIVYATAAPIPLPGTAVLFLSGLLGIFGLRRRPVLS